MKYDYKEETKIDPDALDVEWLDQPNRIGRWSKLLAKARRRLNKIEELIKVLRSEYILKVHRESEKIFGKGTKPTAPMVEAFYRTQRPYKEAKEDWIKATFAVNVLEGAVESFRHRRYSLQDLVQLHGQNYFAGPLEPRNLTREHQQRVKSDKAREKIMNSLNG